MVANPETNTQTLRVKLRLGGLYYSQKTFDPNWQIEVNREMGTYSLFDINSLHSWTYSAICLFILRND